MITLPSSYKGRQWSSELLADSQSHFHRATNIRKVRSANRKGAGVCVARLERAYEGNVAAHVHQDFAATCSPGYEQWHGKFQRSQWETFSTNVNQSS